MMFIAAIAMVIAGSVMQAYAAKSGFMVGEKDRVVIYGDSITAGVGVQTYPRYVETYIRTRYPDWKGEAWNRGLSGDNAGNMKRFRAQCLPLNPTVITFNMGMNDSGWGPDFPRALSRYYTNLVAIATEVSTNLPKAKLVFCSAIPYEMNADYMLGAKANALHHFARIEEQVAEKTGCKFIDVNKAYADFLGEMEILNKDAMSFSNDGVHPGVMGGHFMLAVAMIEGLGADPFLASCEINAAKAKLVSAKDVEVKDIAATPAGITFTRKLAKSPFPAIKALEEQQLVYFERALYKRFHIADRLNKDTVKITGLADGNYDVLIDGQVYGTFAAWEFAEGVNFGEFCDSPDFERACRLSDAVGEKQVAQMSLMYAEQAKEPDAAKIAEWNDKLSKASAAISQWTHPEIRNIEIRKTDRKFDPWNRVQEAVSFGPAPKQKTTSRGFGTVGELQSRGDGWVKTDYSVTLKNFSDQDRRCEVSGPEGFTPNGMTFILKPGESTNCTFHIELAPNAVPPVMKMKHTRTDLLGVPTVMHLPFIIRRNQNFRLVGGVRKAEVPLIPDSEADQRHSFGMGDLSGKAKLFSRNDRMSIDVTVNDTDHVNGFTNEHIGWDDSLSVNLGKVGYTLAWTKNGAMIQPTNGIEKIKYDVKRDNALGTTRYTLEFPYRPETNAVNFSLVVFDRDSDQTAKFAKWAGQLRFGMANCAEIADYGIPVATVVNPNNQFWLATQLLTNYIYKINGTQLPVVTNRSFVASNAPVIELRIGKGLNDANKFIADQSYRIYKAGNGIVIESPTETGIGYGVSGFLTEVLGCRFYQRDFEKIPFTETIAFNALSTGGKPSFQMRGGVWGVKYVDGWGKDRKPTWFLKNRAGGLPYTHLNATHNFSTWQANAGKEIGIEKDLFKEKPEWYAMGTDGKRQQTWNYGICGTNPEFAEALGKALITSVSNRIAQLEKKGQKPTPDTYMHAIAQGDGFSPCYCPECRKLVNDEGSDSAPQILLFNRALDVACKVYPETSVVTFGYFSTLLPPKTMNIHSNIWVEIVSSSLSMNQSGDQFNGIVGNPANRHYEAAHREWGKRHPGRVTTYHWDGVDGGNSEYSEWPNVIPFANDIKFWYECGVACAQKAGGPRPNWGDLTHWMWYNLMWNIDQDPWKMAEQYFTDVFNAKIAKIYMDYFHYMDKVRTEAGYGCPTVRWTSWAPIMLDKVFTQEVRTKLDQFTDAAIVEAKRSGDEGILKRAIRVKATTIDELQLNASKSKPYGFVTDTETGKPWIVHGNDPKNPGRVNRLGGYAWDHPAYWAPEQMRSFATRAAGSEVNWMKDGDVEAAVARELAGRIVSFKKDGIEVFANDAGGIGYADKIGGYSKAWRPSTNATEKAVDNRCAIGPAEWYGGYNDHFMDRQITLDNGKLKIERKYWRPARHGSYNTRFTGSWALAMPSTADALVGVMGGGIKQVVSLAGCDKATVSGKNLKRAADRLAADCQNPLFDVLEEVAASGDVTLPVTDTNGVITVAYTRGDGVVVEIECEAAGLEKVVISPDAKLAKVTVDFVPVDPKLTAVPKGAYELKLPVQTAVIKGKVTKTFPKAEIVTPKGELKVKKIDENHAINLADGAEMIRIPAGKFIRGSKEGPNDEQPQREINLSEYWIYKEPVTLYMFTNNLAKISPDATFSKHWGQGQMLDKSVPADKYPVLLGWYEAEAYARSVGGELPTEAQWEKAARGDKDARVYPWGDKWDGTKAVGWEKTLEAHLDGMFPSGSCPEGNSPYGVVDMSGNNFEWVRDWYGHDYYKSCPATDPKGPAAGVNKVLRGGDSNFSEDLHRCSARFLCPPTNRDYVKVTFRVVVEEKIK